MRNLELLFVATILCFVACNVNMDFSIGSSLSRTWRPIPNENVYFTNDTATVESIRFTESLESVHVFYTDSDVAPRVFFISWIDSSRFSIDNYSEKIDKRFQVEVHLAKSPAKDTLVLNCYTCIISPKFKLYSEE